MLLRRWNSNISLQMVGNILLFFVFVALPVAQGLYFHIAETERKCFIEEIPDETMVIGNQTIKIIGFYPKVLNSPPPQKPDNRTQFHLFIIYVLSIKYRKLQVATLRPPNKWICTIQSGNRHARGD